METNNSKKKLMILGGSRYIIPLIKKAHELGIFVITCDYLPNNYAHKYSDLYANVSIIDKEAVLKKAQELKIDGISSFACDPGVVTAAYVAEKMGLPNVGPYESVCVLQNKARFRDFLRKHGFNAPLSKGYTNIEDAIVDSSSFKWPVIVKPTDSAGSKGVKRVDKLDELRPAIENALKSSHSGEFIVEEFLQQVECSSDCDSVSIDGKLAFCSFSSQMFDDESENIYTPSAYYWPSTMSEVNIKELTSEIQRLISLLNMKTSIYNIETRECTDGKPYIMEFSPRGGGNRLSEMMELATNYNIIENHIRYCVGLPLKDTFPRCEPSLVVEVILHSTKQGTFKKLSIDKTISNKIVENDLWIKVGEYVGGFKGANEAIGTLVLKFDNMFELNRFVNDIDKYVKVIVDEQ